MAERCDEAEAYDIFCNIFASREAHTMRFLNLPSIGHGVVPVGFAFRFADDDT
jgi:hypothetical protein